MRLTTYFCVIFSVFMVSSAGLEAQEPVQRGEVDRDAAFAIYMNPKEQLRIETTTVEPPGPVAPSPLCVEYRAPCDLRRYGTRVGTRSKGSAKAGWWEIELKMGSGRQEPSIVVSGPEDFTDFSSDFTVRTLTAGTFEISGLIRAAAWGDHTSAELDGCWVDVPCPPKEPESEQKIVFMVKEPSTVATDHDATTPVVGPGAELRK